MGKTAQQTSMWHLEGRFLGFIFEDGKLKRLRLMTVTGEYRIKLAKEVRASIDTTLMLGLWIQVWGEQKISNETNGSKLKASKITITTPEKTEVAPSGKPERPASATVLVCQKSDCLKRGGKAVCRALEAALSDRNLTEVSIRGTGCMKQCKAGPNIVFMPEKARYSRVAAQNVATLVDEQFPRQPQQESDN